MPSVRNAQQAIAILCTAAFSARMCLVWLKIIMVSMMLMLNRNVNMYFAERDHQCTDGKIFASASLTTSISKPSAVCYTSNDIYTEWATKKHPAFRFARVLVVFSLALVCILLRVFQ